MEKDRQTDTHRRTDKQEQQGKDTWRMRRKKESENRERAREIEK